MNEGERKIGLSLRANVEAEEFERLEDYRRRAAAAGSGLEDTASPVRFAYRLVPASDSVGG